MVMPSAPSLAAVARPMPQTSDAENASMISRRSRSSLRSATPSNAGCFLAVALASLANVFVPAIPMQVGIVVQQRTCSRMALAWVSRLRVSKPARSRKLSSME